MVVRLGGLRVARPRTRRIMALRWLLFFLLAALVLWLSLQSWQRGRPPAAEVQYGTFLRPIVCSLCVSPTERRIGHAYPTQAARVLR
jgi:hypothetical protein